MNQIYTSSCLISRHNKHLIKCSKTFFQHISTKGKQPLPFSAIPGIKNTLSNYLEYVREGGIQNTNKIQQKRFERYGPIYVEKKFNKWVVNIADAEASSNVLRAEQVFSKRPFTDVVDKSFEEFGLGLGTNNYDLWYKDRSLLSSKMMRLKEVNQFLPNFNEVSKIAVNQFCFQPKNYMYQENLERKLSCWVAECLSIFLIGQKFGFLDHPPNQKVIKLLETVKEMNTNFSKIIFGSPHHQYFNTPTVKKFRSCMKILNDVHGQVLIDFALNREENHCKENRSNIEENEATSLFEYLNAQGQTLETIQTLLIFQLGSAVDSTSSPAFWITYLLSKNPKSQEKLYDELISVLGPGGEVSRKNINRLPYLKACVKESMRLRPLFPANFRELETDFEVLGYKVPAGALLVLNTFLLSTSEKYYGENANEFVPERWFGTSAEKLAMREKFVHFTSLPFGYGVRMCLGRRIAEAMYYSLFSKLVLNCHLEYVGQREPNVVLSPALNPDIPLQVKFTPRSSLQ